MTQRNVLPIASFCSGDTTAHRTAARRDVLGSRLLLIDRTAILQSGLPDVASRSFGRRGEVWLPSRPWACDTGFLSSVGFSPYPPHFYRNSKPRVGTPG
jgi:hypothetical protein